MSMPPPASAQVPEAAAPGPNPNATVMTKAQPGVSLTATAIDPSGVPMDLASIDALFAGNAKVEVPQDLVKGLEPVPPPPTSIVAGFTPSEPAPSPEPAPEVTEAPAAEVPAADAPAVEAVKPPEPERILPHRIPTANVDTQGQKALKVQHEMNDGLKPGDPGFTTLADAIEIVKGRAATSVVPRPGPVDIATTQLETAKSQVTEAKAALKDLQLKRQEAAEFGTETTELDQQINDAIEKVSEAVVTAKFAERDIKQAQDGQKLTAQQSEAKARAVAEKQAGEQFPSVMVHNSALRQKVDELAAAMQSSTHPDHAVLYSPNAALITTRMAAEALALEASKAGTPFAQAYAALMAAPAAAPAPVPVVEARKILPAPGGAPTSQAAAPPTGEQILMEAGTDPAKLEAIAAEVSPFGGKHFLRF